MRPGGLGQALKDHLPRQTALWVLIVSALGCLLLGGWLPLLVAGLAFFALRRSMLRRLGGTTGDTAGALLELLELAVVLTLACNIS